MRPISENVARVLEDTVDVAYCKVGGPAVLQAREAAEATVQAYLTECWVVFDKDDESTWPVYNGDYILRMWPKEEPNVTLEGDWSYFGIGHWRDKTFFNKDLDLITHYLDPADILPEGM